MDNRMNNNIDGKSANKYEEVVLFAIALLGLLAMVLYWR